MRKLKKISTAVSANVSEERKWHQKKLRRPDQEITHPSGYCEKFVVSLRFAMKLGSRRIMKRILAQLFGFLLLSACDAAAGKNGQINETDKYQSNATLDRSSYSSTDRFALLALNCVHREYPNKISHVLQSTDDVQPPHKLTPAFYGCYDWHSAVHGHWLLVRVLKSHPDTLFNKEIREALDRSFTVENLESELAYYTSDGRGSFERPYGIAWFLQLVAELEESTDPDMQVWRSNLRPLEGAIVSQIKAWLPKLSYPIRLGTHNQTAFSFGLMIDYARTVDDEILEEALVNKTLEFHLNDVNCPLSYEPSGEDFLSPCLMEADLMRRVLSAKDFARWLTEFLPNLPTDGSADWLPPGIVLDASDGKLVHLDGVNLSRAWALEGIASALPENDERIASLLATSNIHRETGIAAVSDEHYSGSHWLASFAIYLTTQRGLNHPNAPS